MEERIAWPLIRAINTVPDVTDVEALSYAGRTQIYVVWEGRERVDDVMQRVKDTIDLLPADCRLTAVDELGTGETMPSPEPGEVEQVEIHMKSEDVLSVLGISKEDAGRALRQLELEKLQNRTADDLELLAVTIDGRQLRLDDLADVIVARVPKCVASDHMGRK